MTGYDFSEFRDGDILELKTKYPLILHYGVIVSDGSGMKIAHYPFPSNPKIQDIQSALEYRPENPIIRYMRTGVSSDSIINRHNNISERVKNNFPNWLTVFNCEDYVRELTGHSIDTDQRITAILVLTLIILLIILVK
jgi:hypothetical protein